MWAVVVGIGAPCSDQLAGMAQVDEQVLIQTFISHASVEAFDEAVLHWLPRRDVMPVDFAIFLPFLDRIRSQIRAIIADHHAWVAAHLSNAVQFTTHAVTRERCIDHSGQTFPAEVINDVQDPEPTATRQAVRYKVQTPPLVGPLQDRHGCSGTDCTLATVPFTNG